MVCFRCKLVVEEELKKLGVHYTTVELGEIEIPEAISTDQRNRLRDVLVKAGLELIDDKKGILVQKIKNAIIELVHFSEEPSSVKLSEFLSQKLNHNYTYLANIFSEVQSSTIEKFYITHKIERAKELLLYNELTLTEISFKIGYSSVAHLSSQFKKVTGLTPSQFKKLKDRKRVLLDDI